MNTRHSRVVLGFVLGLGLLSMVPATALAAQPSCGDTLFVSTKLTANLDCSGHLGSALEFGVSGITLDLNGKTITGPAGNEGYEGVDINGFNRVTIRNGTIRDYFVGVEVDHSNRTTLAFLNIDGEDASYGYGVLVWGGVKNMIHHLTVADVSYGVYNVYSAETTLRDSNLTAQTALYQEETTKSVISNNVLSGSHYGVHDLRSHRNVYSGNRSNGGQYGFLLQCDGSGTVTLNGNTANNNSNSGFYLYWCFVIDHPLDGHIGTRVTNNTANGNGTGFLSIDSFNELWRGNTGNDNEAEGFYFDSPGGSRIVRNKALRNAEGFYIEDNWGVFDADRINFNTARKNDNYGFFAVFGTNSQDNVATLNGINCLNVDC